LVVLMSVAVPSGRALSPALCALPERDWAVGRRAGAAPRGSLHRSQGQLAPETVRCRLKTAPASHFLRLCVLL